MKSLAFLLVAVVGARAGANKFVWDPSTSPWKDKTLTGFKVTLRSVAPEAHTYLVVNLANGGYGYLPDIPEGGWSDEYKSKKMVFRRVPAGSYTLGMSTADAIRSPPHLPVSAFT